MEYFSKQNLFIYCCVAACLSLLSYLIAFSCEVSWILEARGVLPSVSYFLCSIFFILFIAAMFLVHGLATVTSWGLFCWSMIIAILAIPELVLVMYMTTQYWGLESSHGLTELISYLLRLIVNCLALMCVIPTGLRWRQEKKVLAQLESLAARLQLTSPSANMGPFNNTVSTNMYDDGTSASLRGSKKMRNSIGSRRPSDYGVDNPGFVQQENPVDIAQYSHYGSQNEFDASIFGLSPSHYIGPPIPNNLAKKTQSLLDLRYFINTTTTTTKIVSSKDETDSLSSLNNHRNTTSIKNKLNNSKNHKKLNNRKLGENGSEESDDDKLIIKTDPIYHTIEPAKSKKALGRNCVSLENLGMLTTTYKNDLNGYAGQEYDMRWNKPLFSHQQNNQQPYYPYQYYQQQQQYLQQYYNQFQFQNAMQMPYYQQQPYGSHISIPVDCNFNQINQINQMNQMNQLNQMTQYQLNNQSAYFNQNPFHGSNATSRQSLGNVSDDFRKYRDVAL